MTRKKKVTLRDLESETKKFLSPKTEKERSILMATIALIGERGVDGATTAEIARRANVTEKTLFRYFPSKTDLVRRVLFPMIMEVGLKRQWEKLEQVLKSPREDVKSWYTAAVSEELAMVSKASSFARVVTRELLQDTQLREIVGKLWLEHVWQPMIDGLQDLRSRGAIRKGVDLDVLARVMQCLHVGYFLTRSAFASELKWDDASEVEKMAELIAHGAVDRSTRKP